MDKLCREAQAGLWQMVRVNRVTVDNVCCVEESTFSTMTQKETAKNLKPLLCHFRHIYKPTLTHTHTQRDRKTQCLQEKASRDTAAFCPLQLYPTCSLPYVKILTQTSPPPLPQVMPPSLPPLRFLFVLLVLCN